MFRQCGEMQQPPRERKYKHAKFWPVPNWSKSGEVVRKRNWSNFSYDSGRLGVGGQWTGSTCLPKATVLNRNILSDVMRPRRVRQVPLRAARSCVTNAALARQFAARQRQRFVDRF